MSTGTVLNMISVAKANTAFSILSNFFEAPDINDYLADLEAFLLLSYIRLYHLTIWPFNDEVSQSSRKPGPHILLTACYHQSWSHSLPYLQLATKAKFRFVTLAQNRTSVLKMHKFNYHFVYTQVPQNE